jgi:hypothetical protein
MNYQSIQNCQKIPKKGRYPTLLAAISDVLIPNGEQLLWESTDSGGIWVLSLEL